MKTEKIAKLRTKYTQGSITHKEVEEYWTYVLKNHEELDLLKTEVNLKEVIKKRKNENSNT